MFFYEIDNGFNHYGAHACMITNEQYSSHRMLMSKHPLTEVLVFCYQQSIISHSQFKYRFIR